MDIMQERLEKALLAGADEVIDSSQPQISLENLGDVVFETAGNRLTTAQLFTVARPGGCAVQVGWPNGNQVEMNIADMIDKELIYKSVNRYANAFDTAVTWLSDGRIRSDVMITHTFSLEEAPEAFRWALENPRKNHEGNCEELIFDQILECSASAAKAGAESFWNQLLLGRKGFCWISTL